MMSERDRVDRLLLELRLLMLRRRSSLEHARRIIESGDWDGIEDQVDNEAQGETPLDPSLSDLLDRVASEVVVDDEVRERYRTGDWSLGGEYRVMKPRKISERYCPRRLT